MQPYDWMYFKPYGSTVNLQPLSNVGACQNPSQCYWLKPDKQTRLTYPITGNDTRKYELLPNGTLTIYDIQESDNGIYHFFKQNNSEQLVSKALLNLHGAPFPSLWLEYWPNVLGGLVAMATVLITFGLIVLANKYRYRAPSRTSGRRSSRRPGTVEPFDHSVVVERTNPVFTDDEIDTNNTHRMRAYSRESSSSTPAADLRVEQL